ncbi:Hypothetical protein NTJ_00110 [Nesidiocoris tenuis]|uniref:Nonstructural protein WIV domain-containing protein n=1 Tax=Nesidiocoris tenuis TaxID=355587 RepID=A0ABN7A7U7_9HEMI|nr:Hypothetical protein NTJ_00109 [Nesidiocoris tenuis]BES87305.1 Hypothetical protein NTJ_00110 [Nesidiocoris tenuis]
MRVTHLLFVISGLSAAMDADASKVAALFTRESLRIQRVHALSVLAVVDQRVYVFDAAGFFSDGTPKTVAGFPVRFKDGKYAYLSDPAQKVFAEKNTYLQFSTNTEFLGDDDIGVFLKKTVKAKMMDDMRRSRELTAKVARGEPLSEEEKTFTPCGGI